jgi:hypothetical protein
MRPICSSMCTTGPPSLGTISIRIERVRFVLCGWLPFCKYLFRAWCFVRSSLVFGLLARRTWPLALMVSTNQVPFRTSNSKRSGQSSGCLGFWADKVPSLHWSCKLLLFRWSVKSFSLCRAHSVLARPRSYGPFCWPWQQPPLYLVCVTGCLQTMDQTFPAPT